MNKEPFQSVIDTAFQNIKKLVTFKKVLVVLGNETCDLDSAISTLIYSLILHMQKSPDSIVIPVFNTPRSHLPVKTEVTHVLKKVGVNLENIICRDEIDLKSLQDCGSLELTLVDHHAMSASDEGLAKSVVAVLDHRPQDPAWLWGDVNLTLQPVGSCSTLVAEKLLSLAPQLVTPTVAMMLLGTILVDTSNLSRELGKASALDLEMVDKLKAHFDHSQLFKELQAAKADVSALTSAQLLVKDLKVAGGIPIAGLPMKVSEFLERADAIDALQQFCKDHSTLVGVIYGKTTMAVFSFTPNEVATKVLAALTTSTDPLLDLEPQTCSLRGVTLFQMKNAKITRKQFLPVIRKVGESVYSTAR